MRLNHTHTHTAAVSKDHTATAPITDNTVIKSIKKGPKLKKNKQNTGDHPWLYNLKMYSAILHSEWGEREGGRK